MTKLEMLHAMDTIVKCMRSKVARDSWNGSVSDLQEIADDEKLFKSTTDKFEKLFKQFSQYGYKFDLGGKTLDEKR